MKTKNKSLNSFLGTLLFTLAITAAVVMSVGSDFLNTFLVVGAVVEIAAFGVVVLQSKGIVFGANAYADTVLLDAMAFIKDVNNKKFQTRPELTNALDVFIKDREYTLPNLSAIRLAETQTTTAMYLKNKDFTETGSKSCTPTGETSGSSVVPVTWVTKTYEVRTAFSQYQGNQVTLTRGLANDLWNLEKTLWRDVDQDAIDFLETNRSGLNNGDSGTFDAANDIMAIAKADANVFYNKVMSDMAMNNYSPNFNDIHNTSWTSTKNFYVNQGAGNNTNTAFQFNGFEFYPSNLIAAGVIGSNNYTSIHYIVPDGAVAVLDWNSHLNRTGKNIGDTKHWYTMQSQMRPEFTLDVFKTENCADTTSDGGKTQDLVDVWEISFTYAFATQPVSGVDETAIFKYGVMDSDSFVS